MSKYLITSALPYANGYIHLGHAAGAYLPADIFARFLRLSAEEVLYICGSDEHGVAITIAAEKENVSPQEIIDKYHYANKEAFSKFGMSFDNYSRTSTLKHKEIAREFFADFLKKNYLVEKEEEQFYDSQAKMFLPDRYVEGVCPNCSFDRARGDQCDNCGAYYNQIELINPISLISKKTPEVKKTTHWYFRFNLFQEFLESYINSHNKDWKDNVLQQTKSWLKQGMAERAITRDLTWGVNIKGLGLDEEKVNGKALYVWFDAVLGYISATKEYFEEKYKDEHSEQIKNLWRNWWQSEDTNYYAFIGKDNIVFHTLIFPAMLFARRDEINKYILPENVPANEFLNLEGEKFSKSRNWSIDLKDFLSDFPQANKVDALRYTLGSNLPENKDADFTWKDFQAKNNNELAAIFGNYINRSLQFLSKNFDSIIPSFKNQSEFVTEWNSALTKLEEIKITESGGGLIAEDYKYLDSNDLALVTELYNSVYNSDNQIRRFRLKEAINTIMNASRAANKYFNDEQPWKTIKTDLEQTKKTMFVCSNIAYSLSILFAPVIPFTSGIIQKLFSLEGDCVTTGQEGEKHQINYWFKATKLNLDSGTVVGIPQILFEKIEDDFVENQISKLGQKLPSSTIDAILATQEKEVEESELIDIDLFKKVKLKTGLIIEAEKVTKSKKMMKLQVDLGTEKRQILAGIAEYYQEKDLVGKTVVVVVNLKPAKLMGLESNGMVLAASLDGKLSLVSPSDVIGSGAEVR